MYYEGELNGNSIARLASEIYYVIKTYKKVCKGITQKPYKKRGAGNQEFMSVNTVVLNLGNKCLNEDVFLISFHFRILYREEKMKQPLVERGGIIRL